MCRVVLGSASRDLKVVDVGVERVKVVTVVRGRFVRGDGRLQSCDPRPAPRAGRSFERSLGIGAEPDLTGRPVPGGHMTRSGLWPFVSEALEVARRRATPDGQRGARARAGSMLASSRHARPISLVGAL